MNELLRLQQKIADDGARTNIESFCFLAMVADGHHWYTECPDDPENETVAPSVEYLTLRGLIARHPDHNDWVRVDIAPHVEQAMRKQEVAVVEWRCFHCDEVFNDAEEAKLHFGISDHSTPGCIIKVETAERSMLYALRKFEAERARYTQEDTDLHRAMYSMQAEHAQRLKREEEEGYARGLRDAFKYPTDALMPEAAIDIGDVTK